MTGNGKIPGQLIRLVIVFATAIIALIIVRAAFVPESFGEKGHYRANVVPIIAAQPVKYAGLPACAECHDDIAQSARSSYHRGLTCEGCHEAAADHIENPTERLPVKPTGRTNCLRCHAYLVSRPTGFPQIVEKIHNPLQPCASCHNPHDPTPPQIPGDCSACHAGIARMKSVSHHWTLSCETCHETPAAHRESPRAHLPKKPTSRDFCGTCHARGAKSDATIPRVDLDTHGGRYVCWQCHFPHDPEGRS